MKTETITWRELPADGLPDALETVLVHTADDIDAGFIDDSVWHWAASGGRVAEPVLAWAQMPWGIA